MNLEMWFKNNSFRYDPAGTQRYFDVDIWLILRCWQTRLPSTLKQRWFDVDIQTRFF